MALFRLDVTWLSLYPRAALAADAGVDEVGTGFRGFGLAHNMPSKKGDRDVLSSAEAAGAQKVKKVKDAEDTIWGGYSGYFADPDARHRGLVA